MGYWLCYTLTFVCFTFLSFDSLTLTLFDSKLLYSLTLTLWLFEFSSKKKHNIISLIPLDSLTFFLKLQRSNKWIYLYTVRISPFKCSGGKHLSIPIFYSQKGVHATQEMFTHQTSKVNCSVSFWEIFMWTLELSILQETKKKRHSYFHPQSGL